MLIIIRHPCLRSEVNVYRNDLRMRAREMAEWVKAPADELRDLYSTPVTHIVEGKTNFFKLTSDLHTFTIGHTCVHIHTR